MKEISKINEKTAESDFNSVVFYLCKDIYAY